MELMELRNQRGVVAKNMRDMLDKAEAEGRDLNAEETPIYDKMFDEQDGLAKRVFRQIKHQELDREMAANALETEKKSDRKNPQSLEERQMSGFRGYLLGNPDADGMAEFRALQADIDTQGGYLVAPEQFVTQLIKFIDDEVFIRQRATVIPVPTADSLGAASLDADPGDAEWTAEIKTGSDDDDMTLGKRELHPHPLARRIKVSKTLLRKSIIPVETLVIARLGYKFGITQEKAFLTGTGANQPLGIFTESADGISTARDVSSDNETTAMTADGLINAKFSLKGGYWKNADWMFHRDGVKQITKLKDGDGQYIWRESLRADEPDRLLGRPIMMSEYAPNTFTTGLYVGVIGDFSHYWIADALNMQVQALRELYAETNQDGFIGRQESDGMPVLEEAFARVKLA